PVPLCVPPEPDVVVPPEPVACVPPDPIAPPLVAPPVPGFARLLPVSSSDELQLIETSSSGSSTTMIGVILFIGFLGQPRPARQRKPNAIDRIRGSRKTRVYSTSYTWPVIADSTSTREGLREPGVDLARHWHGRECHHCSARIVPWSSKRLWI